MPSKLGIHRGWEPSVLGHKALGEQASRPSGEAQGVFGVTWLYSR